MSLSPVAHSTLALYFRCRAYKLEKFKNGPVLLADSLIRYGVTFPSSN
jgi:hypothetical protein